MKNRDTARLALLAGGLVLLAFIVPSMAQDRKAPGDKAAGKLAGKAGDKKGPLLKAKINPKMIIAHKGTPKKFVPFELKDLRNPKTGKPPAKESDELVLHSGRKTTYKKHLAALNKIEKNLAEVWGRSLRDEKKRVKLQELAVDRAKLKEQAKIDPALVKREVKFQAKTVKELEKGHAERVKAALIAKEKIDIGGGPVLRPVSTVKTFADSWGDPSTFGTEVTAQLTLKGDTQGTSIAAERRVQGKVFGYSKDLLLVSANLTAARSGAMTAKVKASIFGVDQAGLDQSETTPWTKSGEFKRDVPEFLRFEHNTTIGPIPVSVEIGVRGSIKVPYYVSLDRGLCEVLLVPEVNSYVYGQAAVDIEIDKGPLEAGVEAGVEAQLTLLSGNYYLYATTKSSSDAKGRWVSEYFDSRDTQTTLGGKLLAYVEVYAAIGPLKLSERFDYELWSSDGFTHDITPFYSVQKRYLQPPDLKR